ncbi:DNA internalization-related competence protein ComEC/Rec2 [Marinobacter sp.]|uniref:DNA internalization-related competence protein ComEC/Rec2 n=1 Tax=Marinobacter sp. TaxID=50741 RepID=UPI0034A4C5E1
MPPLSWVVGAVVFAICVAISRGHRSGGGVACLFAWLIIGTGWASWHATERLQQVLPAALEGQVLSVSGYLCEIPSNGSFNSLRFSFCITQWHFPDDAEETRSSLPQKIRLAWYGTEDKVLPDHRLRLKVVLKRPQGAMNPVGFRYETWLFRKGFGATGTVRDLEADPAQPCGLQCRYMAWRGDLAASVATTMGSAEQYPLLASLLIGYRGEMTPGHWDVLKATGTIHLVAISGLHLGLVAIGAGFLARRLVNALPAGLMAPRSQRYVVIFLIALASLVYALAAGFTVPTRRALVMVLIAGWVLVQGRQVSAWHGLSLALFVVVLTDPFAPLDQGFWLSFGAVSVLVLVFAGRLSPPGWLMALLVAQLAVFAGLWPVLSMLDQSQPLTGLFANLFAIPWVSFVVMPLLMIGSALMWLLPWSQDIVLTAFDAALGVLWSVLAWLSALELPAYNPGAGAAAVAGVLVLAVLVIPAYRFRWAVVLTGGMTLGSASLLPEPGNPWVDTPEIHVWDVGQGLSVLLRHRDQVLLYDTGPAVPGVFSAVESVLIPNLNHLGVEVINTLVVSHGDSDHAGGLAALMSAFPVRRLVTGEPERVAAILGDVAAPTAEACHEISAGTVGGVVIRYWQTPAAKNANDTSCVVTVTRADGAVQVILPGDITEAVEKRMVEGRVFDSNPVDRVVVAPHHGSKTSSSYPWVRSLAPEWVIYSAGYRHRFGHPHPDVISRYRTVDTRQLNTAYSGAIRLELGENGVTVRQQRSAAPFWIRGSVKDWFAL